MTSRFLLTILISVAPVSCAGSTQHENPLSARAELREEAWRHWSHNEELLRRLVAGEKVDRDEFVSAVSFFERTTGIPSRHSRSFVGPLPNANLDEDLEHWRAWYNKNKARLYWDPAAGDVKVLGTPGAAPVRGTGGIDR